MLVRQLWMTRGSGYPKGLVGESIPIEERITAISDGFYALTTPRPYKPAWPIEQAVAHIREQSGSHFDPALVQLFDERLDDIVEIRTS